jgi:hypothetical protein
VDWRAYRLAVDGFASRYRRMTKRGEHRMVMHLHGWWLILYYPWFLLLLAASPFLEKRLAKHFGEERTQFVLGSTLILLFIFPVILCVVRLTRYAILSFY